MNLIRTIIVDDEPEAREGVKLLLEDDAEIDILGMCKNGVEAIEMIQSHDVDLMFLDIQMPLVNGFEVINSVVKERLPFIVFVTAYDQYALKAFEIHAVDYLLKPFTNARFAKAISRAKQLVAQQKLESEQKKLKILAQQLSDQRASQSAIRSNDGHGIIDQRLIVKDQGKIQFLNFDDIFWFEAYDYYVKVHVIDGYHLIRESLKKLLEKLPVSHFVRIHKSSIVNSNYIKQIEPSGNGEHVIHLMNGARVKVSRSYREVIKKLIE